MAAVPLGKAALAATGLAISAFIGRALGSEAFGLYAAATTTVTIFAGIVQHVADAAHLRALDDPAGAGEATIVHAGAALRAIGALVSILLVLGAALAASALGLEVPFSGGMIAAICLGIAATILMSAAQIVHQSRRHFLSYLGLDAAMYGLRVAGLAVLGTVGSLTATLAILVHAAAPAFAALIGRPHVRGRAGWDETRDAMRRMLRLGGWIGLAFVFSILMSKVDLLLLVFYAPSSEAGLYAAAVNLAIVAEFAGAFLLVVSYPRVLGWYREGHLRRILGLFLLAGAPFAALVGWIGTVWSVPIVTLVYGASFAAAGPIFALLLPATLLMMLVQPIAAPFINLRAPRTLCAIEAAALVSTVILLLAAIPDHGAIGAAFVVLGMRLAVGLIILSWAWINATPAEPAPGALQQSR